jgi:antitoxin component YwqK of YwqJK toxin-antitoxin module
MLPRMRTGHVAAAGMVWVGLACGRGAPAWVDHVAEGGGFSVRAPAVMTSAPGPLGKAQAVFHRTALDGVAYEVAEVNASPAMATDSWALAKAVFNSAVVSAGSGGSDEGLSTAHEGMLALEGDVHTAGKGRAAVRVVAQWPRAWVLRLSAAEAGAISGVKDRFFSSFHVLEPRPAAAALSATPAESAPAECTGRVVEREASAVVGTSRVCVNDQGVEHGPITTVDALGRLLEQGAHLDGKPHGLWKRWRADGSPLSETEYVAGVKAGRETLFDAKGERESEGANVDGKKHGLWIDWLPKGLKLRETHWERGVRQGRATEWDDRGGKKAEGSYADGAKEGLWTSYHPNGRQASQGTMHNNEPVGVWARWDEEGTKDNSVEYKNGVAQVLEDQARCPAGTIRAERMVFSGHEEWCETTQELLYGQQVTRHGPYARYGADGQLLERGNFKDNQRVGTWELLDTNGRVVSETAYRKGRQVTQRRTHR